METIEKDERKKSKIILNIVLQVAVGILITAVFTLYFIIRWSIEEYDFSMDSILYTITNSNEGANDAFLMSAVHYCVPKIVTFVLVYLLVVSLANFAICMKQRGFLPKVRKSIAERAKNYTALLVSVCLLFLTGFSYHAYYTADAYYEVTAYLHNSRLKTTLYEDYFVNPKDAEISFTGTKKKNLVYIYLESMETTYTSVENNGSQTRDLIPNLVELAAENAYFSHTDGFGGLYMTSGATATIMALLASTSGVPYAFPAGGTGAGNHGKFASGVTALGDILEDFGYRQTFLCGSQAIFAGRDRLFQQHGGYEIYDLITARQNGDLPSSDYYDGWWGFEDTHLYDIAKKRITELSKGDAPFNFTMLTVDTHAPSGHKCELCKDYPGTVAEAVTACADRQLSEFMDWCKRQDFYEDTVFVISGDHLRMDKSLSTDKCERAIYNCFINGERPAEYNGKNRTATIMDVFPTTLYSLGFTWKGERLGLGTNLFSDEKTLAEEIGLETLNLQIERKSAYYLTNFS